MDCDILKNICDDRFSDESPMLNGRADADFLELPPTESEG